LEEAFLVVLPESILGSFKLVIAVNDSGIHFVWYLWFNSWG